MADKARKNRALAMNMGVKRSRLSVKASINLWEALVRPSLEYGAEIWGSAKWEVAEVIQREMGRKILRCSPKAANASVRGELDHGCSARVHETQVLDSHLIDG